LVIILALAARILGIGGIPGPTLDPGLRPESAGVPDPDRTQADSSAKRLSGDRVHSQALEWRDAGAADHGHCPGSPARGDVACTPDAPAPTRKLVASRKDREAINLSAPAARSVRHHRAVER
jgi:hypothetical protein